MTEIEQLRAEVAALRREVEALKTRAPLSLHGQVSLDGRQVGVTIGKYVARPDDIIS